MLNTTVETLALLYMVLDDIVHEGILCRYQYNIENI